MFAPPNWWGLGVFALLGCLHPDFWLLAVAVELVSDLLILWN